MGAGAAAGGEPYGVMGEDGDGVAKHSSAAVHNDVSGSVVQAGLITGGVVVTTGTPTRSEVDEWAEGLAQGMRTLWRQEEAHRHVHDPVALPVRWHPAPEAVADHWINIRRLPSGATADPLGDQLRGLRERAGYSGKRFAELTGWNASKVSKVENGKQLPTDSDMVTWTQALGVSESAAAELRDELRAIRLEASSWKRQLRVGHRPRQEQSREAEQAATSIRVFELVVVPGLVQTADYARHVFTTAAGLQRTPHDTDAAVQVRLERQHALYDSARHVELLIAESALRYFVCPPETMLAQLDRLLALVGLRSVRLGIIPLNTQLPHIPAAGFWIVDDAVEVEIANTEIRTNEPEDVDLYNRLMDTLWTVAVQGETARRLIVDVSTDLARVSGTGHQEGGAR